MTWITLSICAALIWAISNLIDKFLLTTWSIRPILPVLAIGIVDLIVSTGIFVFYPVPLLPVPLLLLAFLAGACYFFNMYLYFYAVKGEDISTVVPLLYLSPLWVALIAHFFLGESLSTQQYFSMCLLIAGAILISVNSIKIPRFNKALFAIVLACFCFAINQTITKYLLEHTDTLSVFAYIRASAFLAMLPLFFINFKLFSECNRQNGAVPLQIMLGNAGLNLLGLFVFVTAANIGYITLVNALVAVQPFFVLSFVLLFHYAYPSLLKGSFEKASLLKKVLAILLMFAGVLLIHQ